MARYAKNRLSAAERREAIMHAAQPLFAARGFDTVTTREVAEAAGISEALLYRHFDSKEALYDAVQAACVARIVDNAKRIEALADRTATLVLATYLMMRNIQLATVPGGAEQDIPRLALRSLLTDAEFARSLVRVGSTHLLDKIERCVRAGIEAGEIEEPLEHGVAGFWFAHHISTAIVFFRLPEEAVVTYPVADREALFHLSVRFALRGLGLTNAAIRRHYDPGAFALLSGPRDQ